MHNPLRYLIFFLIVLIIACRNKLQEHLPERPNIVFIMADDHANKAISAYHEGLIRTPNLDRIANRGIIFNNAFVTNSICAPSRAVILTGKFSHLNGVTGNAQVFDGNQQTFPKILQQNGYQTAMIGKWHLKSAPTGFDYWNILPGQGDYYNPDFIKMGKDTLYAGYVTDIISTLSLDWLDNRDKDKPFCLMIHHKAPHRSWMPAIKNLNLFNDTDFPLPENFYDNYQGREGLKKQMLTVRDHMDIRMDFKVPCQTCDTASVNHWAPAEYWRRLSRLSPDALEKWMEAYQTEALEFDKVRDDDMRFDQWKFRRYMEDYLRCIVSVDESVGKVLNVLEEDGLDKNTMVVYTSDQGFYLGEHGLFDKRFMYEEALRTPLMIQYSHEIEDKTKAEYLAQNLDIAPTLLDVAGIPIPEAMQGRSLRAIWQQKNPAWRDQIYYHYYEEGFGASPHYGIRTTRYKLIHYYKGLDSWELYDLDTDPTEMNNLYEATGYEKTVQNLKNELSRLRLKYNDVGE